MRFSKTFRNRWDSQRHWVSDNFSHALKERWGSKNTKQATIFSKTFRNRWDSQIYLEIDEILKNTLK